MADEEHLKIIKQGVEAWNVWRKENPGTIPDLHNADLGGADLHSADLSHANILRADLSGASLSEADLSDANLNRANLNSADLNHASLNGTSLHNAELCDADLRNTDLSGADLQESELGGADLQSSNLRSVNFRGADLAYANLSQADLRNANLCAVDLNNADLSAADLSGASLLETSFVNVDLTETKGLENCNHGGPSIVDHRTLERSNHVPLNFWRGCGLSEQLIDYFPSMAGNAIQFYSCFISYSSKDQVFADRLHADLQDNGVRCWFAPHDLEIGGVIQEDIDRQIRLHEKVILILSEASVASAWVTREVKTTLEEEASGRRVLFPVRLDDEVMNTTDQWAQDIKRTRNIGDFTEWKNHDAYLVTFERVLRDLKTKR